MKFLLSFIKKVGLTSLLLFTFFSAFASHNVGCTITYECLGLSQYEFTMTCYRDCNGINMPSSTTLTFNNNGSCGGAVTNLSLNSVPALSGIDVSQLCDPSSSTCQGGGSQGTEQWVYTGITVLPAGCIWTVGYSTCCRSAAITNITGGATYVSTTVNTMINPCNNSVEFSNLPIIYTCDSVLSFYNHGAFDPDGDTLNFSLVCPTTALGTCCTYNAGFTPTDPMQLVPGSTFQFDPATGQMTFLPADNVPQVVIVSVQIDEIRNGMIIASTTREVQIVVLTNCNNDPPAVDSNSIQGSALTITNTSLEMCRGSFAEFKLVVEDPNGDSLTVTSNIVSAVPGAIVNFVLDDSVIDSVVLTFTINSTNLTPGIYPFTININDNACPVPSVQFLGYALIVYGANYTNNIYCLNEPDPIPIIIGDSIGIFSELLSNPAGLVFDSITGIIDLDSSALGTYQILYTLDSISICPSDSITVSIIDVPDASFNYPQVLYCRGGTPPVPIITGTPGGTFSSPSGVVNPFSGVVDLAASSIGQHIIYYDIVGGSCAAQDSFIIDITELVFFEATASKLFICPERLDTIQLGVNVLYNGTSPVGPTYLWSPNSNIDNINIQNPEIIILTPQDYDVVFDDGICPVKFDTIDISAPYPVDLTVSSDVVLCNGDSAQIGVSVPVTPGNQGVCSNGPFTITVEDTTFYTLNVSGVAPAIMNSGLVSSMEFVIDMGMNAMADIELYLIAPSGEVVPVTYHHGGLGFTLVNASFSTTPGNQSLALYTGAFPLMPANGNFLPVGGLTGFNNLVGATTNGNWQLMIVHVSALGTNTLDGTLNQWCLNFPDLSATSFVWTPDNGISGTLSCSQCDSPTVSPVVNTVYTVVGQNAFGCTDTASVNVSLDTSLPAVITSCGLASINSVTFNWVPVFGAADYLVTINNGTPQVLASTTDSLIVTGLIQGQCVTMIIIPRSGNTCNDGLPDTITCCVPVCGIDPQPINANGPTTFCSHQSVVLSVPNGPVSYLWSTGETTQAITVNTTQLIGVTATDVFGCLDTGSVNTVVLADPLPGITASGPTDFCQGASVQLNAGAGFSSYLWNVGVTQSVTVNATGTYIVTVTDANGCFGIDSIAVQEGSPIVLNIFGTNTTCNGMLSPDGQALAVPSGSFPPYSYLWNAAAQTNSLAVNLAPGIFCVTVTDASSCTAAFCVGISEPPVDTVPISATNVSCFGGNDGTASSGQGSIGTPVTYLWSPSGQTTQVATGLIAGVYCVDVFDSLGCSVNRCITITEPSATVTSTASVTSAYASGAQISCQDSCDATALVVGAGGLPPVTGYIYQWDVNANSQTTDSASGLCDGVFSVTVTDSIGCNSIAFITVSEPTAVSVSSSVSSNYNGASISCQDSCDGALTALPSGGSAGYTFLWSDGQTAVTASGICAGNYSLTVSDQNGCTSSSSVSISEPTAVSISSTVSSNYNGTSISCQDSCDGELTAVGLGGTGGLSYLWSDAQATAIASGMCAGTFSVTVTDANGCSDTVSTNITEPSSVQLNTIQSNVTCFNGSDADATATASGGTGSFNFVWSPSGQTTSTATGLGAGLQCVSVSDVNGCLADTCITIIQPAVSVTSTASVSSIFTSGSQISCQDSCDGAATVVGLGGTPAVTGYIYQWDANANSQTSDIATGLCAGTYDVTVTDSLGCSSIASVTVSEPTAVSVSSSVSSNYNGASISCQDSCDGALTALPSGGSAVYTFLWSDGQTTATASGICAGSYSLTVSDQNGCSSSSSVSISEPTAVSVSSAVSSTYNGAPISCNGTCDGELTAVGLGGTGGLSYLWSDAQITAIASGVCDGTFSVTVTDANGCFDTVSVSISEPSAVTATSTSTDALCNGNSDGTATATALGGTGVYSYVWSTLPGQSTAIATGLNAATSIYTVIASDLNNCTTTSSVTISEPTAITATLTTTAVSCNGGDDGLATINAVGGTPGVPNAYTYDWGLGFVTSTSSPGAPFGTAGVQSVVVSDANGCTISENYTITEPAAISFTVGSTDASCNGYSDGSASINVSGGLGGFSYTWSTSAQTTATATGLSAGQHCVTVSDGNGCTVDTCITVSEPSGFSIPSFSSIPASCFGGSDGQLSVTVTGAIAPYSYLWSAGGQTTQTAVGLSAIVHTVTISDANGCTVTGNAAVAEPTAIQVSLNVDSVQCKNGSNGQIAATASGGSFPYTYLWDANASNQNTAIATGLSIGTYSLTVTDFNGCTLSTSAEVFEPLTILTASIINSSNPLCNGVCDGSIEVDALGATPNYTYQWNNGQTSSIATGLCSGVQSVTVSDQSNCTVTTSGVLSDPPAIAISPSVVSNFNGAAISCPGANDGSVQVTASGGTGTLNYTWSPNGQNTALISNLLADNYCVSVSDQNGCQVDTCIEIVDPVLLAASFIKVDILCHGDANGQILVTATPGTGTIGINGYEYRIVGPGQSGTVFSSINSFSNLAAGNYIVTVRDGNNCEVDLAIAIVEPSPVVFAALSTTDALCNGGSSGTATATISGGTAGYSFVWSGSSQTVQTASGLAAGVYSVTASDANGCDVVDVFTIDEPTALIGTVSSSNIACIGGVATATAIASGGSPIGLTSYLYNWSNGQTASTAVNLSAGQQCVTITDNNTCTVVNCITISEPSTAVGLSISGQTAAGCNGSADGTATAQGNGGTAGYSYVWQTVPAQSTQTATGLSAGVYVVAVSDSNGCNATASVTISDPSGISATISGTTDASCNGSADGTATAQGSGGTPGYSYLWSDGQTNNTATGISAGAYTVIVTDANGCSISIAATIVAPTAVNITQLLSTDVACKGDADGTASLSMNGGTAPYSFTWSGAVGQTGFVATGLSAGSQTVTATDANGCSTVDTFVINEPAQGMSGLLVGQDALCDGVSNGELGAIVQGGTGSYSYLWSDGQTTVVADLIAAGSYSLTVTDASGCALVLNGSIGQASAVSVTASVQQSVTCAGGSDAIAVAQSASGGTPDYSYVWSDALGQTGQTANGLTVGIYTVVATDSNFCTGSSTVTITEPTAMTVVASIDDASCNGLSDGQINIVSSNKVIANYSWSAGLGNPLLGLSAGTYELTATDVDGCQDSFSYSVTEPDALLSDIALQSSISCNGSADGAAIVSSSGGSPSYTYAWNNGTSGNSLSNLGPGNYTVTVTDAKGCTETESISLSEPNELTISGSTTGTLCAGDATGIIEASGLGGTVVVGMLEYSLDGSSWQQGNLFSGLTSGIYDLQVRDENGCIASTQVVVEDADPLFISAMTPNLSVEYLDSISISATLNDTTGVSYSWTQLEGSTLGLITDSSYQFEINPIEKVSYLFSATNSRGCRVDSIVIIEVRKPRRASAPTGFTPNGDGVNDYFFVQGGEKIAEVALFRVYDRWGSLVFEGQSLEVNIAEQGWNGSFRGQECSSGAYTWYADIRFKDGETTQLKGEVVLLR